MSQASVERTLGKLITDKCFRDRFFKDPARASFYAGLELSPGELEALSRLPKKVLGQFSARLDDRICRLPLDMDQRSVPVGVIDVQENRLTAESLAVCTGVRHPRKMEGTVQSESPGHPCATSTHQSGGHDRDPK
jgi:hypothetical protein